MQLPRHTVTVGNDDWAALQGLAERMVRDGELPEDVPPKGGRVSAMLRLISRGVLIVTRPESDGVLQDVK